MHTFGFVCLRCRRFHVLLNFLFKDLFHFPSWYLFTIGLVLYLALDGDYHPIRAAFPNNPTLGTAPGRTVVFIRALHPHWGLCHNHVDFEHLRHAVSTEPKTTFPNSSHCRIRSWAFPSSLAATRGIPVGFFSST